MFVLVLGQHDDKVFKCNNNKKKKENRFPASLDAIGINLFFLLMQHLFDAYNLSECFYFELLRPRLQIPDIRFLNGQRKEKSINVLPL